MIALEEKYQREPVVMSMVNDLCIWGRAGVIKPVKCTKAFDCPGCPMDLQVVGNFAEKRGTVDNTDNTSPRALLLHQGKCRHMLSGLISYGLCANGYDCTKCAFDQMVEDAGFSPN